MKQFRERLERVTGREERIRDVKRNKMNHHELIRQARKNKASAREQVFQMNVLNERQLAGE